MLRASPLGIWNTISQPLWTIFSCLFRVCIPPGLTLCRTLSIFNQFQPQNELQEILCPKHVYNRIPSIPSPLHKMSSMISTLCLSCEKEGLILSNWWVCPAIYQFWKVVHTMMVEVYTFPVEKSPQPNTFFTSQLCKLHCIATLWLCISSKQLGCVSWRTGALKLSLP